MIRLERALAASDKAKISEYMVGLQATEKGLQNQIKGLQLANAALKQNATEIQNINNKQAEQSVYAKKNIDAVKARQALLQKEIALEQEKLRGVILILQKRLLPVPKSVEIFPDILPDLFHVSRVVNLEVMGILLVMGCGETIAQIISDIGMIPVQTILKEFTAFL